MVDRVVREPQGGVTAVLTDLAARIARFGGLSGKMRTMSWDRLGDEVRLRRKQLKLTQPELAERGGFSVATIRSIETNRAGRLSPRLRRALERAIEWEAGSIDAVLQGDAPSVLGAGASTAAAVAPGGRDAAAAAAERFAMAERLVKMRQAFAHHRDSMTEPARTAMEEEFKAAAREIEEAMIWMLPWLGDNERAKAIHILAELRDD
ncbi:MAG: helix-turn-helix domain-containing protein [Mycobacteriaceae bacterium]|nr:helix-turn-helix domain-containing protein [Mycobacteriaceae bacterium]